MRSKIITISLGKKLLFIAIVLAGLSSCVNNSVATKNNSQAITKSNQAFKYESQVKYKNNYQKNPLFAQFIGTAIKKYKFNQAELDALFSQIKNRPDIIKLMNRQAEDRPWYKYKTYFLNQKRVRGGVRFWRKNAKLLAQAQEKFGVPAEIIVAIIGVETRYGQHMGRSRVLESLSTLAFDYPRRAKFFQSELHHFLILSREQKFKPLDIKGSFAGAMGVPQFIPSSYRRYSIDFNGDGKKDLFNSKADIIGSVGNYFHTFGWRRGQAIATRARVRGKKFKKLPTPKLKPYATLKKFKAFNVKPRYPSSRWASTRKAALLTLKQRRYSEYWFGFHNFYVITRYNHSTHYAMAVFQLSKRIKRARNKQIKRARAKSKSRAK